MITFIKTLLIIHAVAGGCALISGLFAIFTKKGSKKHILGGRVYFWSMLIVVISGLIVGAYKNNIFIQTIAVFSFYMVFTGRRVLRFKKEISPKSIDWVFNIASLLTALYMLGYGVLVVKKIGFGGMAPMLLVFGGLLFTMVMQDFRKLWTKKWVKNAWLFDHISRMGGSYIATTTAFLVVNINFQPVWIVWLLPTVVGTPILIRTSSQWKKKLNPKPKKEN